MNKKRATQPLSDNTRKLIIIIAIVLVAVIILSVALALILKTDVKIPADDNVDNSNQSTLAIKNGDFQYANSSDTGYPHTAVNWTKYAYKDGSEFESISSNDKSLMGIINVNDDNWAEVKQDLDAEGISIDNPKAHADIEADDDNVYMIYNKEATTASILSDSASIASGVSVKITVWFNAKYVAEGSKAVIMVQKSTVSAKEDNWYAYNFEVAYDENEADENGWQKFEFFIFNRESSTKYIRVSVGLGNVYEGTEAEGVLFVDDISYDSSITANDYRKEVDEVEADYERYKIIENEDITDKSEYFELVAAEDTEEVKPYTTSKEYVEDAGYSPFTNRDDFLRDGVETNFTIFKVTQEGNGVTALRLGTDINLVASPIDKDHYHISFWVRVEQNNGHAATQANVYVQKWVDSDNDWKDLDNGSFEAITTSQDLDTDTNCGWVKYDIYLKPSTAKAETISILFVLGDKDGYDDEQQLNGEVPQGSLYVTSPAWEKISYKDYNNASGTNVKKLNLIGDSASTSVTNGSFSDYNNTGNEPANWAPVFAGDNSIYKDGKGNTLDNDKHKAELVAGSGIEKGFEESAVDDSQKSVLRISTAGTNFGYISNDITLSSRTVYVFSVMVKLGEDATNPFIYLIDNSKDNRKDAIVARVEKSHDLDTQNKLDDYFNYYTAGDIVDETNGWIRYYLVYVTGNESASVRIALFNGAIDAVDEDADFASGTIYYDNVTMRAIGSYTFDTDVEDDATNYPVTFNATSGYDEVFEDLFGENTDGSLNEESELAKLVGLVTPDEEAWNEMTTIPEETDDDDGDDEEDTTTATPSEVDWGLLMSVISSVLLVAALLIVFVIKVFQRKRPRAA